MGPRLAARISDPGTRNILITAVPGHIMRGEILDEYNPTSSNIPMIYASIMITSRMFSLSWPELNDQLGGNFDSVLSIIIADVLRNSANLAGYTVILSDEIVATVTVRIYFM